MTQLEHFYPKDLNEVSPMLLGLLSKGGINSIIDLGSSYADLFYALRENKLLPIDCAAVEIMPEKCQQIRITMPDVAVYCGDMRDTIDKIGRKFDLVVCEHVIEHMEDDRSLLLQIKNLMAENGKLYISSVIQEKGAWWFHKYKGHVRISPDHVKEYASKEEFEGLLNKAGFKVIGVEKNKLLFILAHWIEPFFSIKILERSYDRSSFLRSMRKRLAVALPRFYTIAALAERV